MSVVVTAIFQPIADRKAELVDALRTTIPGVHDERGCRLYAIHDADDGTIVMIEKWETREDLAEHSTGEAVKALRAAVADLVAAPPTVTTMTPLPAGGAEHGKL